LIKFTVATGHEPQNLQLAVESYATILSAMGQTDDEIKARLDALGMGLPLSNKVWQDDEDVE
jgi:hypothetical protein